MARRQKTPTSGDGEADLAKGNARGTVGKRRGLGDLGLRAFQEAAPELTLLPQRDSFAPAEIEELTGLRPAQLRRITRDFPTLQAGRAGSARRYSRQQVEGMLRVKRLLLEQELPLAEVQERLRALSDLRALPRGPRPSAALSGDLAAAGEAALPEAPAQLALPAPAAFAALPAAAGVPAALLAQLRGELEAIIALCSEPEPLA